MWFVSILRKGETRVAVYLNAPSEWTWSGASDWRGREGCETQCKTGCIEKVSYCIDVAPFGRIVAFISATLRIAWFRNAVPASCPWEFDLKQVK